VTRTRLTVIIAAAALGFGTPALAQTRAVVTSAGLDAAVAARPAAATRTALRTFLATDAARTEAARLGADAADLSAHVAGLDDAAIDQFAERTGFSDRVLAGGDSRIVISTTAIIIALLVLILVTD
jgi:hypothetical protein